MERMPSIPPGPEGERRGSTDAEKFREYVQELDLTAEDFEKKILDIGAGSAQFAKYAREHEISQDVYSLEPREGVLREKEKAVVGMAQQLPFADNSFELVVSWAAIPNMFSEAQNEKVLHRNIKESLSEMLRVTKPGGEVRFGPIGEGVEEEWVENHRRLGAELEKVLVELANSEEISVEKEQRGFFLKYDNKGGVALQTPKFLIKIKKQK